MSAAATLPRFISLHPSFERILGEDPGSRLLCDVSQDGRGLFHEACIYHRPSKSVFVTSNQLCDDSKGSKEETNGKVVKLFRVYDNESNAELAQYEEVKFPGIESAMLNGGVNAGLHDTDTFLFCAQGSKALNALSGIISVTLPTATMEQAKVESIVSNFHGTPFNSVNDVIVHPKDASVWFTDPSYGFHQGIRDQPQLPNQVYRLDVQSASVRAVANGFSRPNGLCFSPDLNTLYVTDTGAIHGSPEVPINAQGPSDIYAFDIVSKPNGSPMLVNKRLFAYAPGRYPDGIKCDTLGNVYAGCGDGVEVWNAGGDLLGIIKIPGGVANFCFGENGNIYACNETRFWKIRLNGEVVKGALLGIQDRA
ncbi:hypothetical protein LTR84_005825 [Exophiala bonariae]|uniref:SMP-30/Gluconolactonase/LRE-like region domain-containing protein n=1 Tax=Exophiala bonariae TaxID=1690606 RepID=A0AAV9N2D8_9EURO|nr:hypothetical protein LTR84_005825 [Exophiala bonariae]